MVISISALFVLLVAAVSTSNQAMLRDVLVDIDFDGENYFIDAADVKESVYDLGYRKD
jgi:cell division protein FtsQ